MSDEDDELDVIVDGYAATDIALPSIWSFAGCSGYGPVGLDDRDITVTVRTDWDAEAFQRALEADMAGALGEAARADAVERAWPDPPR